ncbi:MAG: ABC-type branched-subunit amino acid transport system ATPase component, partial [Planctomycetota bacterium]
MTAILHMRDVSLGYGDTHVLSGVNLKLPRGA